MLKTYDVTCPDCEEDFEVEMDPLTEEECIECPNCFNEFDWEHIADTDTIELMPYEEDEIDGAPLADEDAEEDELA